MINIRYSHSSCCTRIQLVLVNFGKGICMDNIRAYSLYPKKEVIKTRGRLVYFGYDPARQVDGSGFCVLEKLPDDSLEVRLLLNLTGLTYFQQIEEIGRIHNKYGLSKGALDSTNNL